MPSKQPSERKRSVRRAGLYLVAAAVLTASLVLEADPVAATSNLAVDSHPEHEGEMFGMLWLKFMLVAVLVLGCGWVVCAWAKLSCEACGRSWAFEATGEKRGEEIAKEIEWQCKHCGEVKWIKEPSHSSWDWSIWDWFD